MEFFKYFLDKRVTGKVNRAIESFFPPVLTDRKLVARFFNFLQGRGFRYIDVAKHPERFPRSIRESDCTPRQWEAATRMLTGTRILDIGCGSGSYVKHLASKGFRTTGIDPQGTPDEGENWRVFKGFVEDMNFPERSFDTVVSFKTLEHIPDARSILESWKSLARYRILLILPCQRYRRYGYDGHVNFYPDENQLRIQLGLSPKTIVKKIDGEWLVAEDVRPQTNA